MAAYCLVYGVIHFTSPAGWLPVHRHQLRAQRSVTSMGKLYLYYLVICRKFCSQHVNYTELSWSSRTRVLNTRCSMGVFTAHELTEHQPSEFCWSRPSRDDDARDQWTRPVTGSFSLVHVLWTSFLAASQASHGCGLLPRTSHVPWSVCVGHTDVCCKSGQTDCDAVREVDSSQPKERCFRWRSRSLSAKLHFTYNGMFAWQHPLRSSRRRDTTQQGRQVAAMRSARLHYYGIYYY